MFIFLPFITGMILLKINSRKNKCGQNYMTKTNTEALYLPLNSRAGEIPFNSVSVCICMKRLKRSYMYKTKFSNAK
jgi:hypothetical protein